MLGQFKSMFWLPPRPHGEVIEDRSVSFLELFYDLVYVVVISRAAHTLAEDVTWQTTGEFVVVFGLIWIAWMNGTIYHDLHGREDGRTRTYVFMQMLLLAALAVFTADAAGTGGRSFALVYTAFLVLLTWLWYAVRRQDSDEYGSITARYLVGMVVSVAVIAFSAFLPDQGRLWVWTSFVAAWVVGTLIWARSSAEVLERTSAMSDSMIERFGLFVIIVLGEVVVGVVDGISSSDRSMAAVSTGMIGLMIGFAFWWTYFDFIGRRFPTTRGGRQAVWMFAHLPVALSIAATGAAMVSLIEHANDVRSPRPTAWLLSASIALGLLSMIVVMRTLNDWSRLPSLYRPTSAGLGIAAGACVMVGWISPAPWLLALSLVFIVAAVWGVAANRWLMLDDPAQALPGAETAPS